MNQVVQRNAKGNNEFWPLNYFFHAQVNSTPLQQQQQQQQQQPKCEKKEKEIEKFLRKMTSHYLL